MKRLDGRVALVTGVSRQISIGAAVVQRLHAEGATVVAAGWPAHDEERDYEVGVSLPVTPMEADFADPTAAVRLVDGVVAMHGAIDIVVAAHARASHGGLDEVEVDELDRSFAVNVSAVLQLAKRFVAVHRPRDASPPVGRMLWFTSGQQIGPMDDEMIYATTKAALYGITPSLSKALADGRIIGNCINPGPVDTGYAEGAVHAKVASMFPDGRWGTPEQMAEFIAFLLSDAGSVIRGQVLDVENGFDRSV